MYSLKDEFRGFYTTSHYCLDLLKTEDSRMPRRTLYINDVCTDEKKVFITTAGVLNALWQSWNKYWRQYWLTQIYGGKGYNGNIPRNAIGLPTLPTGSFSEGVAIYQLLSSLAWNMGRYRHGIVQPFQEPTWGDVDFIERIALAHSSSPSQPGTRILSALSVLGNSAKHLQAVRNYSVHFSPAGLLYIRSNISPHYNVTSFKYPTDVVFGHVLGGRKRVIVDWIEELNTLLQLI